MIDDDDDDDEQMTARTLIHWAFTKMGGAIFLNHLHQRANHRKKRRPRCSGAYLPNTAYHSRMMFSTLIVALVVCPAAHAVSVHRTTQQSRTIAPAHHGSLHNVTLQGGPSTQANTSLSVVPTAAAASAPSAQVSALLKKFTDAIGDSNVDAAAACCTANLVFDAPEGTTSTLQEAKDSVFSTARPPIDSVVKDWEKTANDVYTRVFTVTYEGESKTVLEEFTLVDDGKEMKISKVHTKLM